MRKPLYISGLNFNVIKYLLHIVSVALAVELWAQDCVVELRAFVEGRRPCGQCMVQVLQRDSTTLVAFRYTDSVGRVQLPLPESSDELLIAVSQFGYRDTIFKVRCGVGDTVYSEVFLRALSIALDEVTVIDKLILMRKSGDTTTFHLRAIELGNEVSAFDIVQRLPGVDIDDRQLKYHGKAIAQILLEDVDLTGSDQVRLLEQIRYDHIDRIQIIENQNLNKVLEVDSSQLEMIMKIDLKGTPSERWRKMYSIQAGGGYDRVYMLQGSGIAIGEKRGIRVKTAVNNSYKSVLGPSIDALVHGVLLQAQLDNWMKVLYEYSVPNPMMKDRLYKRVEREVRLLWAHEGEQSTFKTMHSIGQVVGRQHSQLQEYYFIDDLFYTTEQEGRMGRTLVHSYTRYMRYRRGFTLDVHLPFDGLLAESVRQMLSRSVQGAFSSEERYRFRRYALHPNYRVEYGIGRFSCQLIGRVFLVRRPYDVQYTSDDVRFHTIKLDEDKEQFGQSGRYDGLVSEHQLRMVYTKGKLKLRYKAIYGMRRERVAVSGENMADDAFTGRSRLIRYSIAHGGELVMDARRFRLVGGVRHYWYEDRIFVDRWRDVGVTPYLFGMYHLSRKWRLSMSYRFKATVPVLRQMKVPALLRDRQRYEEGRLPLGAQERRRAFQLSLFKVFETGSGVYNFNLMASYTLPYRAFLLQLDAPNALTATHWTTSTIRDERSLNMSYWYDKRWWSVRVHTMALSRLYERGGRSRRQEMYNIEVRVRHKGRKVQVRNVLRINVLRNPEGPIRWYTTLRYGGGPSYVYGNFLQDVRFEIYAVAVSGSWTVRPIVSAYSTYRIPKAAAEVSLRLSNLTNWKRSALTTTSVSPSVVVLRTEALQSGEMMLVVRKMF